MIIISLLTVLVAFIVFIFKLLKPGSGKTRIFSFRLYGPLLILAMSFFMFTSPNDVYRNNLEVMFSFLYIISLFLCLLGVIAPRLFFSKGKWLRLKSLLLFLGCAILFFNLASAAKPEYTAEELAKIAKLEAIAQAKENAEAKAKAEQKAKKEREKKVEEETKAKAVMEIIAKTEAEQKVKEETVKTEEKAKEEVNKQSDKPNLGITAEELVDKINEIIKDVKLDEYGYQAVYEDVNNKYSRIFLSIESSTQPTFGATVIRNTNGKIEEIYLIHDGTTGDSASAANFLAFANAMYMALEPPIFMTDFFIKRYGEDLIDLLDEEKEKIVKGQTKLSLVKYGDFQGHKMELKNVPVSLFFIRHKDNEEMKDNTISEVKLHELLSMEQSR
jgi:hypothetical protein